LNNTIIYTGFVKSSVSYADVLPNDYKSYLQLGNLYYYYGKYDQARSYYEKALLIVPEKFHVLLSLASVKTEVGDFNSALQDYKELLGLCKIPQEKVTVYKSLEDYYFLRGQVNKAIEYIELRIAEQQKFATQLEILMTRFQSIERYILAGKSDAAFQIAREIEDLGPPLDYLIPIGYIRIYLELEEITRIEEYLRQVEEIVESMQLEVFRFLIFWARGKIYEIKGDYETAIQHYKKYLEGEPTSLAMNFHLGRCYRMNRDFRKAEEHFQKIIDLHPFWPEELYEFGLVYAEWGKPEKALEYLRRAQNIWADADSIYKPARQNMEKIAEMEAQVR